MARMFGGGRSPHTLGGKLMRMNWILLLAIAILAGIGTGVLTSVTEARSSHGQSGTRYGSWSALGSSS